MNKTGKEAMKAVGSAVVGGAVGAGVSTVIGGVGVAAVGTAFAAPLAAIGAGVFLAGYGCYWLGKQVGGNGNGPAPNPTGDIDKPPAGGPQLATNAGEGSANSIDDGPQP